MVIDRDHPIPFNLKNPSAAELFRVLLLSPSKCEVRSPLKRCRENKMYTIKNFQISEITCDDNGSYKDSNTVKTKYFVHMDENDDRICKRCSSNKWKIVLQGAERKAILRYRGPYGKYLHTRSLLQN